MSQKQHILIFDLGRVMLEICDDWQEAAQRAKVQIDIAKIPSHDPIDSPLLAAMETGKTNIDQFSQSISQIIKAPAADIKKAFLHWLKGPMPGMVELVKELKTQGYPTACLSNTSHMHWDMMLDPSSEYYLALDQIFDHYLASHILGMMKPDAEIYEHVEKLIGKQPQQIVFFDDNPANIKAAKARDWMAILITPDKPVTEQVQAVVDSL